MAEQYDPRYVEGVECFNRRAFFRAHEAWEALWVDTPGPSRRYFQGLIQVAVCLHHFGNGNLRGARKLYHSSTEYLRAYLPHHAGLDVERLLRDLQACCAALVIDSADGPQASLVLEQIPRIQLD